MVINRKTTSTDRVKFISYTGRYPNLCSGILTLEIEGKEYTFGDDYRDNTHGTYRQFWSSGGKCGFYNNYQDSYINDGDWLIDADYLPEEFQQYIYEIDEVFNANVPYGCCGGCL